jgi:hypothetical protein
MISIYVRKKWCQQLALRIEIVIKIIQFIELVLCLFSSARAYSVLMT